MDLQLLGVKDAARILHISPKQVCILIKEGKLLASKYSNRFMIERDEIKSFVDRMKVCTPESNR